MTYEGPFRDPRWHDPRKGPIPDGFRMVPDSRIGAGGNIVIERIPKEEDQ